MHIKGQNIRQQYTLAGFTNIIVYAYQRSKYSTTIHARGFYEHHCVCISEVKIFDNNTRRVIKFLTRVLSWSQCHRPTTSLCSPRVHDTAFWKLPTDPRSLQRTSRWGVSVVFKLRRTTAIKYKTLICISQPNVSATATQPSSGCTPKLWKGNY
jgi:hypothetical protein